MTDRPSHVPSHGRGGVPRSTLRGAVIGYGFIASQGHVPAYLQNTDRFEIVAVADLSPARRELARKALPHARIYEDDVSLLAGELTVEKSEGRLDFVDICTPPSEHARIARAALRGGLHVLCEKPIATRTEEVHAMMADARDAQRVLFPSHNYKHAPVVRAVRKALDEGVIGGVKLVTLQTFRNTHAKGVPEWRPDWRRERRYSGGGIAMDHGSHTLYLAFDWLDAYPTAITAKTWTQGRSEQGSFDTEDNFSASMTFPNGGIATAELSWTSGIRRVIYTIHGERGAIRVEDDDVEVSMMIGDPKAVTAGKPMTWETKRERISSDWRDASHVTWFGSLFAQFAHAIETNDYIGREIEDALHCIETISNAYASAADGSRERQLPRAHRPSIGQEKGPERGQEKGPDASVGTISDPRLGTRRVA